MNWQYREYLGYSLGKKLTLFFVAMIKGGAKRIPIFKEEDKSLDSASCPSELSAIMFLLCRTRKLASHLE